MSAPAPTDWQALPTPALLLDVQRMDANIAATATTFAGHGVGLRPHFKTSKCLQVAARQRAAGALGFTVSTPAEVELLAGQGFTDLLWAHQPVGEAKVQTAVRYAASGQLTAIADSLAVAEPVSAAAEAAGVIVPMLLEVDTGQGRTGVAPADAVAVAAQLAELPGISLRGVVTHEGHVGAVPSPGEREAAADKVGADLVTTAKTLRDNGIDCEVVSVGATPSMARAPFAAGVTEGRPGTYVYYDGHQTRLGVCTLDQCATSVLATVVSVNRAGTAIIDAGTKAMSSDLPLPDLGMGTPIDLLGRPLPGIEFRSANEEHGFLTGDATAALSVGDRLRIVPNHACGTENMWSRLIAVLPDGGVEEWAIHARH